MNAQEKGHTLIVRPENADSAAFATELRDNVPGHESFNIIADLSGIAPLNAKAIAAFSSVAKSIGKNKKSFVLVAPGADFHKVPDSLNVSPTLQEAHDLIEMEEIERDLGF